MVVPWILLAYLGACDTADGDSGLQQGEVQEYCQWEAFNASCALDEVILMQTARYGRMQIGRCVSKNYGYVGCGIDLLGHIDSMCSGRRQCKFIIPDETMRDLRPCPKDFSSYLDASFICAKVETPSSANSQPCESSSQGVPSRELNVTSSSGYLSSRIAAEDGFGSDLCPWIIRADQGQRINITLLDFSLGASLTGNDVHKARAHSRTFCHKYAVIKEKGSIRETVVCGGESREQSVYISAGNTIEIQLMRYNTPKKEAFFLLKYEAIGCPVFVPPRDGVVEHSGNRIVVTCNHTRERSYLSCNGKTWVGELRNCSPADDDPETLWAVIGDDWSSPFGILIVTAMGVALGLVIGVIMLTSVLFCLKRRNRCIARRAQYVASPAESEDEERDEYTTPYCKRNSSAGLVDQVELVNLNTDSNYGAMWKSRPPSYSPATGNTGSDHHDHPEPPPPPPPQARNIHNLVSTDLSAPASAPSSAISAKLAALTSFRPQEVHVYESPKFIRRDGDMGIMRESLATQPREVS